MPEALRDKRTHRDRSPSADGKSHRRTSSCRGRRPPAWADACRGTNPADFSNHRFVSECKTWCYLAEFSAGHPLLTAVGPYQRPGMPSRAGRLRRQRRAPARKATPTLIGASIFPSHTENIVVVRQRNGVVEEYLPVH